MSLQSMSSKEGVAQPAVDSSLKRKSWFLRDFVAFMEPWQMSQGKWVFVETWIRTYRWEMWAFLRGWCGVHWSQVLSWIIGRRDLGREAGTE